MINYLLKFKNFDKNFHFFAPFSLFMMIFIGIFAFFAIKISPIDYQQSNAVYIMYIHVPAAWMALLIYTIMAVFNIFGFVFKNPFFHLISRSIAMIGLIFTALTLITGSLWGKPIWGTYWVFDARLTSMLILLFLYAGYVFLLDAFDDYEKSQKIAAILSIVGFVNIPFIKFSVEYFNSLHQPASIMRKNGVAIDSAMLRPLLLMFGVYFCYFVFLSLIRVKSEIMARKIRFNQLKNA